ncbi:MAG: FprA family A-type flavoprotein [Chloroflexi bacterium]|nr:FprA family A-type flavoprotein [Chloroflexota bacterium]
MAIPPKAVELASGITWVGIEDFQRRVFDALIPLPYGTSYNSYLVKGNEKLALIDTGYSPFEQEYRAKIAGVANMETLDYLVMNHAEPDHGGCMPGVLASAPNARLIATKKGVEMAGLFHGVPEDRCLAVKTGDTIDLGGKTLQFIEAPWLHWPETMFTFAVEDRVLFTCDFFGAHVASDRLFADEVGPIVLPEAKTYFAEIMMPYTKMAAAGLDKARAVNPAVIAPSHGPVHRDPAEILRAYEDWIRGPLKKKAVLPYVTMFDSTRKLIDAVADSLSSEDIEAVPYDLLVLNVSQISRDLVDASAIVLGSPTLLGGLHPVAASGLTLVKALRPRLKLAAFVGSYGWGGGAGSQAKGALEALRFEVVDILDITGPPHEKDIERAAQLGQTLARRIKGNPQLVSGE